MGKSPRWQLAAGARGKVLKPHAAGGAADVDGVQQILDVAPGDASAFSSPVSAEAEQGGGPVTSALASGRIPGYKDAQESE